ncbi:invasion associated locus B family protein [Aurantimonas sp. Leaf443]|uniref:invasion associated locus B family protein n=1 Tax=Aurantimonas sp. Leaf443 TaxID=1736378 RepID=UPI0006FFF21A|nr:invasion associated locus B family protein [Aurantimonas sp. Leaf443]KQT83490.1 Invasion associated locus B family protein [Aurantimonas sp. Leaf443]
MFDVSRKTLAAGLAALALSATVAQAQDAAPKPAAPAPAAAAAGQPARGAPVPTEWFKVCSKQGENDICNTQYTLIADTRQLITAVNLIDVKGKVNQKVLQAVVPTGRVIPAGVQIKIDTSAPQALNYSVCFPDRCIAEAQLTDATIAALKKGSQMTVTSINFQRQANPVAVTLAGFSKAFDGPAKAQPELAQRQQELNDALQKQADARRKKFEDAQEAAKAAQ